MGTVLSPQPKLEPKHESPVSEITKASVEIRFFGNHDLIVVVNANHSVIMHSYVQVLNGFWGVLILTDI